MVSIGHTLVIQQIVALTIKNKTKTMELFFNQLQVICMSYTIMPFNLDFLMLRAKYNLQFTLQEECILYKSIADVLELLLYMFVSSTGQAVH